MLDPKKCFARNGCAGPHPRHSFKYLLNRMNVAFAVHWPSEVRVWMISSKGEIVSRHPRLTPGVYRKGTNREFVKRSKTLHGRVRVGLGEPFRYTPSSSQTVKTQLIDSGLVGSTDSRSTHPREGTTREEDAQGTPIQSHISLSILVYGDKTDRFRGRLRSSSDLGTNFRSPLVKMGDGVQTIKPLHFGGGSCDFDPNSTSVQGYFTHKKPPTPLLPP